MVLVVASLLLVGACGGGGGNGAEGPSATGGDGTTGGGAGATPEEIVVAVGNDLISLDPQAVQDYPGRVIFANVFETLVARDTSGELVPVLAASMPTPIDPTTVEFVLRDDVTWQDGSPFVAADVAYSVNRVIDPEYETQQATLFSTVAGAVAVDDRTVRITTDAPDPVLTARLSLLLIVKDGDAERPDFAEAPMGTGPYEFVSRSPGGDTVIEKWADYRTELVDAPNRLVLRVLPEPRTRVAALENGEVDIVPGLSPDDVPLVPRTEAVTGTETMLLRLNMRAGVLEDDTIRQAINVAINRQELVDTLFSGYAEPAACQISAPTVFGHDPSLEVPPFDPELAAELLEEAGGPVTLTMTAPATRFPKGREIAQAIAAYLTDVGFEVALEFPSDQVMARQLLQPPSFPDMFMYSANTEFFDETKQLQWLTTTGQFSGSSDEGIDELADQAEQEPDDVAREALFHQINQRACENVSNVYLYVAQDIYGLSDDISWLPRADGFIVAAEMAGA
jgi:peptide/nickel transport system substrate-binding protein